MAQLRHDYPEFKAANSQVLVVVPNGQKLIARHVSQYAPPYPILSDRGSQVAAQFVIVTKRAILLTTMTPTVFLIDTRGVIRYANYNTSYIEEPDNREPLAILAHLRLTDQASISP
jgi:peroxiredoxin